MSAFTLIQYADLSFQLAGQQSEWSVKCGAAGFCGDLNCSSLIRVIFSEIRLQTKLSSQKTSSPGQQNEITVSLISNVDSLRSK
jgi:hypothetical protein